MLGASYFHAFHVQDCEAVPWCTGQRTVLISTVICPISALVPEVIRKAILLAFVGTLFSLSGPFWLPGKVVTNRLCEDNIKINYEIFNSVMSVCVS